MSWETASGVQVDHPFFRHSEKQTHEPVTGTIVHGSIPAWLEGTLVRNGPGIQKVGNTSYSHLFDGLAVLHKFTIKNGKATYQSRALESDAYQKNFAANRIVVSEFGTTAFPDPCQSILGRLQSTFMKVLGSRNPDKMEMTDNCSVNVAYYGDQLYAMTETVFLRRLNPEDLKCIGGKTRIKNYCALNTATAHPHCLEDGTILNVGNNYRHKKGPHYCFVKVPPAYGIEETAYKDATIIAEIPSRWKFNPAYFHSFGMTKDKIIFIEAPLCVNIPSIIASPLTKMPISECLKWYPSEKTRIHVVTMEGGKPHPITYETDPFFTFHHINAYEENGFLVVDVAAYKDAKIVQNAKADLVGKEINDFEGATARRYILPLTIEGAMAGENLVTFPDTSATAVLRKGTTSIVDLTPHHLSQDWVELPRINYKYNGKKYKFMYAIRSSVSMKDVIPVPNIISKINVTNGTSVDYLTKELYVSEPIFVQDTTAVHAEEDDGIVLTAVMHQDPKDVSLVILDAKTMTEKCSIKFRAEGAVTSTFHGLWAQTN